MYATINVIPKDIECRKPSDPSHRPATRAFKRLGERITRLLRTLLVCLLAPVAGAAAQENPLSAHNRTAYEGLKSILLRSAEKTPEQDYHFKPTDAVRSFGEILGHLADTQYLFCSIVLGENNPAPKFEQTPDGMCSCSRRSKADLIVALKDAFATAIRPTTA